MITYRDVQTTCTPSDHDWTNGKFQKDQTTCKTVGGVAKHSLIASREG